MGNTSEQLIRLIEQTEDYKPNIKMESSQNSGILKVVTLEELLIMDIPERRMLLEPFLTEQGLVMLYAKRVLEKLI